jgi:hypothetical protein
MAIQIADSMITDKVGRVARATGMSTTAVVELALDLWLSEMAESSDQRAVMAARMAQLDALIPRAGSSEPIN